MGPGDLKKIFCGLSQSTDENLLVGFNTSDDAAVYKLNDDTAIIQTADFITPVVDDPFLFGQIAAANSLSDIYAMGGKVLTALNLTLFDSCNFSSEVMNEILKGGENKLKEAGGILVGGHTIEDIEMKYGLSVMGVAHPNKILRNNASVIGNDLILTKPLGIGVLTTGIKADLVSTNGIKAAVYVMAFLNKKASELALKYGADAATDVTGFGFLGHLSEMLNQNISFEISSNEIEILSEALELASMGIIPAGSYKNRDYLQKNINFKNISEDMQMILFDAQTSGGLIISINETKSRELLKELIDSGIDARLVGKAIQKKEDFAIAIF
ncbi:MAG: selenide, water dikinase SelD [Pseudomonadota bacterium]